MAKPSRKKAASRRRPAKAKPAAAPKPVDVVTTAPEPEQPETVAELQAEIAAFDHDGDGHVGGSKPQGEETAGDAVVPAAPFERCMVGSVEARVGRVPLGAVLGLLNLEGLRRIDAEKSTASFESVRQRLLATDGRATPAVFASGLDPDAAPSILHGFQEIAAAQDTGLDQVTVILIPAGGVDAAQSYIVEMVRQQRMQDKPDKDDDLFYRVHAED